MGFVSRYGYRGGGAGYVESILAYKGYMSAGLEATRTCMQMCAAVK